MKVTLVVASGAHQGKVIPITGSQFLIGRDSTCHLRPASQAISKRHCGVLVRDGKVYVEDFGSTNGTTVNEELLKDGEIAIADGATLKLGPLDFVVRIEVAAPNPDGTPLPSGSAESAAALAAVKAAAGVVARAPVRDATPNPSRPVKPGSKEAPALAAVKQVAANKSATPPPHSTQDEHDNIAAMLLGMDDGAPIPDGSTVVDAPAVDAQGQPIPPADAAKSDDKNNKKSSTSREEMSTAASDALRRMMRRPK